MKVSIDCKYFLGDKPCKPNKESAKICQCDDYIKAGKRILIIKLGAIGDVIRTTPIVRKLREDNKNCEIVWLTFTPDVLDGVVDTPLGFTLENIIRILGDSWDIAYNFDKSKDACSLFNLIKSKTKKGFKLENGKCHPMDKGAEHKFLTGIFDQVGEDSKTSYIEDTFSIAGLTYSKEKYLITKPEPINDQRINKIKTPIVGLNTGCGKGWPSREWPTDYWIELSKILTKNGVSTILLGGEAEHKKNTEISESSDALYFGYFPLKQFIYLVDKCRLVVTSVTMALHVAIALNKKILLFNNVFNDNEFELYGLGEIIKPKTKTKFYNTEKDDSLREIKPNFVYQKIKSLLSL